MIIFSNFCIDCTWQKESYILPPLVALIKTNFGGGHVENKEMLKTTSTMVNYACSSLLWQSNYSNRKGRATTDSYPIWKVFVTEFHRILRNKLESCGLDRWTVRWIRNWLDGCIQSYNEQLNDQVESSNMWCPSRICIGAKLIKYLHQWHSGIECVWPQYHGKTK